MAKAGGGIVSTVGATRLQSVEQLVEGALARVDALIAEGVSLIEIKSGYGLDIQTELRMWRAARAIEAARPVRVVTSFLGAHAMPPYEDMSPEDYIEKPVFRHCAKHTKRGWWMQWMGFVSRLPSALSRSPLCLM